MQPVQGASLLHLFDLDVDLDSFLVLNEMTQHLGIGTSSSASNGVYRGRLLLLSSYALSFSVSS